MIKQYSFKDEHYFTVRRLLSASGGTQIGLIDSQHVETVILVFDFASDFVEHILI